MENSEENNVQPPQTIRDEMVETAVKFLQNPSVQMNPLAQKQKFLQRKGLSDEEIRLACEKSGAYAQHDKQVNAKTTLAPSSSYPGGNLIHYDSRKMASLTLFERIREVVHNIAIFSVVAYVVHKIYQKYIAPFLFGKKKKSVEESVEDLEKHMTNSVDELKDELQNIKVEVFKLSQETEDTKDRHYQELKSEITSVKGLLLSRKQFPSAGAPVVPPSIPAWQLSSVPQNDEGDHGTEEVGEEEEERKEDLLLEELGSGGSSEHDHMKTSESSLEIIYSSRDCDAESVHSRKSNP